MAQGVPVPGLGTGGARVGEYAASLNPLTRQAARRDRGRPVQAAGVEGCGWHLSSALLRLTDETEWCTRMREPEPQPNEAASTRKDALFVYPIHTRPACRPENAEEPQCGTNNTLRVWLYERVTGVNTLRVVICMWGSFALVFGGGDVRIGLFTLVSKISLLIR